MDRVCMSLLSHDLCRRVGVVVSAFWGRGAHAHFCACVWKPEVSAKCLPQLQSTLVCETWFPTD